MRNDVITREHEPSIVGTAAPLVLTLADEAATAQLAARLAAQPLVRDAFIALHGDLGAGKTSFVRHLLRALGVTGRIKSPTFAVVEPHQPPEGLPVWHFDFYRFADPREWEEAGFRDIFAAPGLKLAEWPENVASALPRADLELHLSPVDSGPDDARQARLVAHGGRGGRLLRAAQEGAA